MNGSKKSNIMLPYSRFKSLYDTGDREVHFSKTSVPTQAE
jgi:hypothetical protein